MDPELKECRELNVPFEDRDVDGGLSKASNERLPVKASTSGSSAPTESMLSCLDMIGSPQWLMSTTYDTGEAPYSLR